MTLFSDAKGRKIVDLTTAATIGKVDDYIVDAGSKTIAAIVMKKATSSGRFIAWENIAAFGDDAVTVKDDSTISEAVGLLADLAEKSKTFHGKQLLSTAGQLLGSVDDIDFDASSGALNNVLIKAGSGIAAERLVATGSYAVIVTGD